MRPLLELRQVSKHYGATIALDGADFELQAGEVHALMGENGAGKSTALGLMYGVNQPNEGKVIIDGTTTRINSIHQAQELGISCVFQELSVAEGLSVAENVFVGRAPTRGGLIDWKRLHEQAQKLLEDFEIDVDVRTPVGSLPIGARQVIEIAKALSLESRILLLDEPTSALSPDEKHALFRLVHRLTARGIGVVYVSHHLPEVLELADRITVFRDGKTISCRTAGDTTESEVVRDMVGSSLETFSVTSDTQPGPVVASMQNLNILGELNDVSLELRQGEILGIAGLLGSGASAIGEVLSGLVQPDTGEMLLNGFKHAPDSFRSAKRSGIAFVPQERKNEGLFMDMTLRGNLIAASMRKHTKVGILQESSAAESATRAIRNFSIHTDGDSLPVSSLSGGNQQKVMLAKWLETDPRLLTVNEPTKGVDIGAKQQIHRALRNAACEGAAILVVSSDFLELIALCDRIAVIRSGSLAGIVEDTSEAELIDLASGTNTSDYESTPVEENVS